MAANASSFQVEEYHLVKVFEREISRGIHKSWGNPSPSVRLSMLCAQIILVCLMLLFLLDVVHAQGRAAPRLVPPSRPQVPPKIALRYAEDSDGDAIADKLSQKLRNATAALQSARNASERQAANVALAKKVNVELIFSEQIQQSQIDAFIALGGEITYIYQAVSYGWNGRIPLQAVAQLRQTVGDALVLAEEPHPMQLHMRIATQTGRVRPVWANGFAGSTGYDGSSDISIAIIDTGVDDSHTDLTGRLAFWNDYTSDAEATPRDIIQHGSHVAGIALGTGASHGTGTTLKFTDSGDLSAVPSGSFFPSLFDFPQVSTTWDATATWLGGGPAATMHYLHRTKGLNDGFVSDGSSSGTSPFLRSAVLTLLSTRAYSAGLLKGGNMSTYAVASSLTGYTAVGDGFNTLSGVAPGCNWVGAKVFTNTGSGSGTDINSAIDDMVVKRSTYNIKVINMSIGIVGDPGISTSQRQKVNTAANNGILPVISAGNDGTGGTAGQREVDDPGRAAMALTIGSTSDINELTDYTSHGFASPGSTSGQEEGYKPDLLAPGGSFYHSSIMSVDTNDADGGNSSFSDVQNNDYYNITGTSMASPFAAGCAALVIDALQSTGNLTGASWDFSSSNDVRLVKMLLTATATETNANREISFGFNPTLERSASGPNGYPAGKDSYEGYGMLNVDAAIEGGTVGYTPGTTANETLGGSDIARRAWARRVSLTSGVAFDPSLTVPGTGDFDLYLYSFSPSSYGTPVILGSSATAGSGTGESISYTPGSNEEALLVVKLVSGSGSFSLTSTPVGPLASTVDVHSSPQVNLALPDWNTTETDKMSVLKFKVADNGVDSLPTLIDKITVGISGTAGQAANDIAWAELRDASARVAVASSITNSQLVFGSTPNSDSAAQLDTVADNSSVEYTVYVYLNSSLLGAHDATYIFDIDETGVGVDSGDSSSMASDSSAVTPVVATIFVTSIGITVTPGTWIIGPQPLSFVGESGSFSVTNDGNVAEDFTIKAADGSGGWTLSGTVGQDAFKFETDKGDDGSYETVLTTSEQSFSTNVSTSGSETLGLKYSAPSANTFGEGVSQDFTITIKASRHVP